MERNLLRFFYSPGLQLVVINTISISEDEEVVLLITFAGFVFDIPVVFSRDLVVVTETKKVSRLIFFWNNI